MSTHVSLQGAMALEMPRQFMSDNMTTPESTMAHQHRKKGVGPVINIIDQYQSMVIGGRLLDTHTITRPGT